MLFFISSNAVFAIEERTPRYNITLLYYLRISTGKAGQSSTQKYIGLVRIIKQICKQISISAKQLF